MEKLAAKEWMQMSASCLQNRPTEPRPNRGFTLLEVLTVVFIIGLAASFAAPNLTRMFDSIFASNERDDLIREINILPYKALETNQDFVLQMVQSESAYSGEQLDQFVDSLELDIPAPYRNSQVKLVNLEVPEGWSVTVKSPILYRASGFCSGGRLTLNSGGNVSEYILDAPYCQIREGN